MHKSVQDIINMKKEKKKISVITSYDYSLASLCDKAGIDVLLVGDSAGMVMLGYENTLNVSMDQMCMFTEAVSRARKNSLLVSDLPFKGRVKVSISHTETHAIAFALTEINNK